MCYTVANNKSDKELQVKYNKKMDDAVKSRQKAFYLNGFGHPNLAIIKSEQSDTITVGKWGLVPSFITDTLQAKEYSVNTLNAKSETIFEKVSFKRSIMPRRCLIPVTGFYEWRDLNKVKYPYYIGLKDEEIFSLGGIYDTWKNKETDETITTFSIITTEANPLMAKIHNLKLRMPLILTKEAEDRWLNPDLNEAQVKELMQPLPDSLMQAHTIKKISPKTVDVFSEELIKAVEYPELVLLES